jgi:hypothetical protein
MKGRSLHVDKEGEARMFRGIIARIQKVIGSWNLKLYTYEKKLHYEVICLSGPSFPYIPNKGMLLRDELQEFAFAIELLRELNQRERENIQLAPYVGHRTKYARQRRRNTFRQK